MFYIFSSLQRKKAGILTPPRHFCISALNFKLSHEINKLLQRKKSFSSSWRITAWNFWEGNKGKKKLSQGRNQFYLGRHQWELQAGALSGALKGTYGGCWEDGTIFWSRFTQRFGCWPPLNGRLVKDSAAVPDDSCQAAKRSVHHRLLKVVSAEKSCL